MEVIGEYVTYNIMTWWLNNIQVLYTMAICVQPLKLLYILQLRFPRSFSVQHEYANITGIEFPEYYRSRRILISLLNDEMKMAHPRTHTQ